MMNALRIEDGIETIRKAMDAAEETYGIKQFAINGYCMGGTFALRAACEIPELKAAAPFYGDINQENVNGLKETALKFKLPVEVVSYDADHAFFNDTRPEVYNPQAAKDAWQK